MTTEDQYNSSLLPHLLYRSSSFPILSLPNLIHHLPSIINYDFELLEQIDKSENIETTLFLMKSPSIARSTSLMIKKADIKIFKVILEGWKGGRVKEEEENDDEMGLILKMEVRPEFIYVISRFKKQIFTLIQKIMKGGEGQDILGSDLQNQKKIKHEQKINSIENGFEKIMGKEGSKESLFIDNDSADTFCYVKNAENINEKFDLNLKVDFDAEIDGRGIEGEIIEILRRMLENLFECLEKFFAIGQFKDKAFWKWIGLRNMSFITQDNPLKIMLFKLFYKYVKSIHVSFVKNRSENKELVDFVSFNECILLYVNVFDNPNGFGVSFKFEQMSNIYEKLLNFLISQESNYISKKLQGEEQQEIHHFINNDYEWTNFNLHFLVKFAKNKYYFSDFDISIDMENLKKEIPQYKEKVIKILVCVDFLIYQIIYLSIVMNNVNKTNIVAKPFSFKILVDKYIDLESSEKYYLYKKDEKKLIINLLISLDRLDNYEYFPDEQVIISQLWQESVNPDKSIVCDMEHDQILKRVEKHKENLEIYLVYRNFNISAKQHHKVKYTAYLLNSSTFDCFISISSTHNVKSNSLKLIFNRLAQMKTERYLFFLFINTQLIYESQIILYTSDSLSILGLDCISKLENNPIINTPVHFMVFRNVHYENLKKENPNSNIDKEYDELNYNITEVINKQEEKKEIEVEKVETEQEESFKSDIQIKERPITKFEKSKKIRGSANKKKISFKLKNFEKNLAYKRSIKVVSRWINQKILMVSLCLTKKGEISLSDEQNKNSLIFTLNPTEESCIASSLNFSFIERKKITKIKYIKLIC